MTNAYITERSKAKKAKVVEVKRFLAAHKDLCSRPYEEVEEMVISQLKSVGLDPMDHATLRKLRHSARRAHGLPFDGIRYPDARSTASSRRLKTKIAMQLAEENWPVDGTKLHALVKERMGVERGLSVDACREVVRKVERQRSRQLPLRAVPNPEPQPDPRWVRKPAAPETPKPAPALTPIETINQRSIESLPSETRAAVDLLLPAMATDEIMAISISVEKDGRVLWSAVRRYRGNL